MPKHPKITDFDFEKECTFCKLKGGLHTKQCEDNTKALRTFRNEAELKMIQPNKPKIDYYKGCQWD